MSEENGTVALQPTPPPGPQPQLQMQITPQGVLLQFPVSLALDNAMMAQLIKTYLHEHPELVDEIVRDALAHKQQELQIIQMVRNSKIN